MNQKQRTVTRIYGELKAQRFQSIFSKAPVSGSDLNIQSL